MSNAIGVLNALQKCRSGKLSAPIIKTLYEADLLRAVLHGSPQDMEYLLINFHPRFSRDAVNVFSSPGFLPEHASLRVVPGTFGVDAIISGQSIKDWVEEEIIKNPVTSNYIYQYCQLSFKQVMRYRWLPCKGYDPLLDPAIEPSYDEALHFLKIDKSRTLTRLVYDLTALPILSAFALIDSKLNFEGLTKKLGKYLQPVRDLYYQNEFTGPMGVDIFDTSVLKGSNYLAVCEFDDVTYGKTGLSFSSSMTEAYRWRAQLMDLPSIERVSLLPCVVLKDSYEVFDRWSTLNGFKPSVRLTIVPPNDQTKTKDINYPVWSTLICGGPRTGKSMSAYYILSALLKGTPEYDVVFVNFKSAPERDNEGSGPALAEAVEFARMINECAAQKIRLVSPNDLERTLVESKNVRAYYTEPYKDLNAKHFIQAIVSALKQQSTRRNCFVVFDEVLNQPKANDFMSEILIAHNQYPSLNFFTGVIAHQLERFWAHNDAQSYAMGSTTVIAGAIQNNDVARFEELRRRAPGNSYLDREISATELAEQGRGKLIFLPYTSTKQGPPMAVALPQLNTPSRDKSADTVNRILADWKWGTDVDD